MIVKKLLESYSIKEEIVFSGFNGLKSEYKQEGINILTEEELKINKIDPEILTPFIKFLQNADRIRCFSFS